MNRKGFTLVELLAMIVVLGILVAISVPNMAGIISKNKKNILEEDINKMALNSRAKITEVEKKLLIGSSSSDTPCIIFTLGYIDSNDDMKKGINGGEYIKKKSFVVVNRKETTGTSTFQYNYYIVLRENADGNSYRTGPIEYASFTRNKEKILADDTTIYIIPSDDLDMEMTSATSLSQANTFVNGINGSTICSRIEKIYDE